MSDAPLPDAPTPTGFVRIGPAVPARPVLIAVPHAGRDYPAAMLANATVGRDALEALEDRHVDTLIGDAVRAGTPAFVASTARSWLDLNRDEREIDPAMIDPPPPAHRLIQSAKIRGGLGLVPRRIAGAGELWRLPLSSAEMDDRIASHHRPYHAAIAATLAAMHARFGAAVLLDCHSMPPVPGEAFGPMSRAAPEIVIGDRYGRSASGRLVERLAALVEGAGLRVARNAPYAGGYTLDRHGRPGRGIHAIQIEIDRSLYLAADRRTLSPGTAAVAALIVAMAAAMADELFGEPPAIAAE
jgi:N-formylglutamate amidohydrolase